MVNENEDRMPRLSVSGHITGTELLWQTREAERRRAEETAGFLAYENDELALEAARLKAENEKLRRALVGLNSAIDNCWNDHRPANRRPAEAHVKSITTWQRISKAALDQSIPKETVK